MNLREHIRTIPDFPKPGILFYDISTLLMHPQGWHATVNQLAEVVIPHKPDLLAGIESRGFLVAAPLAYQLGLGFAMVRKAGKLPGATVPFTYDLEYGSDTIEIQADAVEPGQRVVLLDDLLNDERRRSAVPQMRRRRPGRRLHHRADLPEGPGEARRPDHHPGGFRRIGRATNRRGDE